MKIATFAGGDDVGGVGYRTATAFNRLKPDWEYRAYCLHPSYLRYPTHTPWTRRSLDDWNAADVHHTHDYIPELGIRRPTVVTFHGTGFRESPDELLAYAGDARILVSTLDLWLAKPADTTWSPQIEDTAALAAMRVPHDGPLRICHAPTNRSLKSTAEFLAACDELPVEVVLIEGKSWAESLTIKATCDILFDQTAYGYGGNSTEAWAMGIPTICGAPDVVMSEYQSRFGYIPFVECTATTIRAAIERLLEPAEREHFSRVGREHAERFHSQEAAIERLAPIYESVAQEGTCMS